MIINSKTKITLISIFVFSNLLQAQNKDSLINKTKEVNLNEIKIIEYRTVNGVGHLPEEKGGIIYAGKKN